MNEETHVPTVMLKEGYWVRIGDESYAVHRIMSVAVTEPEPSETTSEWWLFGIVLIFVGIFAGTNAHSWIVGLLIGVALFFGVVYFISASEQRAEQRKEREKERKGFPRNVEIKLDKKRPCMVAVGIPKADAERLQAEIEAIVAAAAKLEVEGPKAQQDN